MIHFCRILSLTARKLLHISGSKPDSRECTLESCFKTPHIPCHLVAAGDIVERESEYGSVLIFSLAAKSDLRDTPFGKVTKNWFLKTDFYNWPSLIGIVKRHGPIKLSILFDDDDDASGARVWRHFRACGSGWCCRMNTCSHASSRWSGNLQLN
jgi:hypothetical protein